MGERHGQRNGNLLQHDDNYCKETKASFSSQSLDFVNVITIFYRDDDGNTEETGSPSCMAHIVSFLHTVDKEEKGSGLVGDSFAQ